MKLSTLAEAVHATLHGDDCEMRVFPFTADTRKIVPGESFVALKGINSDGHDYITTAIAKGAPIILAARGPLNESECQVRFLEATDPLKALGALATCWRQAYPIPLVGITGSCGKTTVKGMSEAICRQAGKTLATQGNLNNHIGVPLTLLRLTSEYQWGVIEMGANHLGEIAYLSQLALPSVSLITNVKPAHLEGFGSVEGVANAKGEIYEGLPPDGIAVLNQEEPFSAFWQSRIGQRKCITFGWDPSANVYASEIELDTFTSQFCLHLEDKSMPVTLSLPGKHMILNALAAAAVGMALGISIESIAAGLAHFQGVSGRLRRLKGRQGASIIDDSYNANPGSMEAALDVLANHPGERLFAMGDMGELGKEISAYHAEVGRQARQKGIQRLFAVGKWSQEAVKAFGEGAMFYSDQTALVEALTRCLHANAVVLVKGSRSAKMEEVTNALLYKDP